MLVIFRDISHQRESWSGMAALLKKDIEFENFKFFIFSNFIVLMTEIRVFESAESNGINFI